MDESQPQPLRDTADVAYAQRLSQRGGVWWKRVLNVQAPYRWNLRRQDLGRTLDVGCGLGRNLENLPAGSVGVDHNPSSIALARAAGLEALTVEEWEASELRRPGAFDSILLAHVVEHMERHQALALLQEYLPYVRPGGKVFFVCPQERGYATDPTHVQFTSGTDLESLAREAGLQPQPSFSFPLPRWTGKAFTYNEFCLLATLPG